MTRCRPFGEGDAAFEQEAAHLVDERRASMHETIAHAVHGLQIQLLVGLDGHEAHVLPRHGFGDGLGVELFLFDLRKGFTNCAGMSLTSWPCWPSAFPRKWAPPQASMPIRELCRFAV
ncbi:MAG TPA: hypothetical protein VN577_14625 [Terriglobales bacterium]|nr:hypothetical protein [Terriglobales bacterium]